MTRSRKRRFGLLFILTALAAGLAGYWLFARYLSFADSPIAGLPPDATLVVAPGNSLPTVLSKLQTLGAPAGQELEWQALARQMKAAGRIQVGEYALPPGITPRQLLASMRDGKVLSYRFTIVEGWNIRDLRAALRRATDLRQETAELDDAALMQALGEPGKHAEGRFLPETYVFRRGDSDLDILKRAMADMNAALAKAWETRAEGIPLTSAYQALILASIVEKETGIASERPDIAGVFTRRLQQGMPLQTDPTVIYGMGSRYTGNIRRSDLTTDTPYNTYTRAGLPPTPIAMPGVAALQAATRPADGDTLYFVAVGDGSGRHVFSRTLSEHNSAVAEYVQRYRQQHAGTQPAAAEDSVAAPPDEATSSPSAPVEAPSP